jgi:hypothetical protein
VNVGNIRGTAAIVTQGGSIKSGNIGGTAELRSKGGSLEVGNIAVTRSSKLPLDTSAAGSVQGRVRAATAGGKSCIREARGDVFARQRTREISRSVKRDDSKRPRPVEISRAGRSAGHLRVIRISAISALNR